MIINKHHQFNTKT